MNLAVDTSAERTQERLRRQADFRRDGAIKVEKLLDADLLAKCRAHYDWSVANPGPFAFNIFDGTIHKTINDNSNPAAQAMYKALVEQLPFAELLADVWGSEHVWYFGEEVFGKEGGEAGRGPWHQDTSYLPWSGSHFANLWISFESIPKANALEVVRGSHKGPTHDGTTFTHPDDPTRPLHGGDTWPRLPDIEAERKIDPGAWDVLSWATEPGDVIMLHPHCLHGGAPVDADCPNRHTLVLRFFGDDAVFRSLPEQSLAGYPRQGVLFTDDLAHLRDGDPFRSPIFQQLR
ncbi:MAG TPA: phytanoyl-CoA dioxygenase family protein [Caulobacteraceae bacterium]|jgi:ectoine hydroxylase-related dioxygenase (phytanoyl-CoA dioxygenase family)|nr:phytanoyl-CoA dioxygenase family protein [Caulobacteraceae bacterium]